MVSGGGGSISSTNVFAALDSLKTKKSDKGSSKKSGSTKEADTPQVFWPLASTLEGKSWADVDDDDDDYYAAAPPPPVWGSSEQGQQETAGSVIEEESESEDDFIEGEDDDDEPKHKPEAPRQAEHVVKKPFPAPVAPKEAERQLSKKELKMKELAELEAVLAELGISGKDNRSSGQNEASDFAEEKKSEEQGGDNDRKENAPAPTESKTSKKKKAKKYKSSKEAKDSTEQSNGLDAGGLEDAVNSTDPTEDDMSAVDMKERLKKVASMKKKKSNKEMDAAARAAAIEAAARSARLAAAKKKEKNHYNQQPVR